MSAREGFLLSILIALGPVRPAVFGTYVVLSVLSFIMYGRDKAAAERGEWRTPEVTLHLVSLVGGWPGAWFGQRFFRHKTRKQPFRTIFFGTAVANCIALGWLLVFLDQGGFE